MKINEFFYLKIQKTIYNINIKKEGIINMNPETIASNLIKLRTKVHSLGFSRDQIRHLEQLSIGSIEDHAMCISVKEIMKNI